jgi:hypothetical protein
MLGYSSFQEIIKLYIPCEIENYTVGLHKVSALELQIVPNISGENALASLSTLQLA